MVWMMLGQKDWAPVNASVALKIVRASGEALTAGVETHMIDGVPVPITDPAKTVADCFKHRNKIRSEEHTSELQSLIRISYAVFCLKNKTPDQKHTRLNTRHYTTTRIPHS